MWKPQVDFFSQKYQVILYDIRGHGRTGISTIKRYSIQLFAEDLSLFIDFLGISRPIVCGLSLGGMVSQVFAVTYPEKLSALILSDTALSTALTFWDKLMVYVFYPKWLMLFILWLLGVRNFIRFSFSIAAFTRGKKWLGGTEIIAYEKSEMLSLDKNEYLKIFAAIYDFRQQPLSTITVPTLVLVGEHESKSVLVHATKIQQLIPHSELKIIPNAGHVTNLENADEFNCSLITFLSKINV